MRYKSSLYDFFRDSPENHNNHRDTNVLDKETYRKYEILPEGNNPYIIDRDKDILDNSNLENLDSLVKDTEVVTPYAGIPLTVKRFSVSNYGDDDYLDLDELLGDDDGGDVADIDLSDLEDYTEDDFNQPEVEVKETLPEDKFDLDKFKKDLTDFENIDSSELSKEKFSDVMSKYFNTKVNKWSSNPFLEGIATSFTREYLKALRKPLNEMDDYYSYILNTLLSNKDRIYNSLKKYKVVSLYDYRILPSNVGTPKLPFMNNIFKELNDIKSLNLDQSVLSSGKPVYCIVEEITPTKVTLSTMNKLFNFLNYREYDNAQTLSLLKSKSMQVKLIDIPLTSFLISQVDMLAQLESINPRMSSSIFGGKGSVNFVQRLLVLDKTLMKRLK